MTVFAFAREHQTLSVVLWWTLSFAVGLVFAVLFQVEEQKHGRESAKRLLIPPEHLAWLSPLGLMPFVGVMDAALLVSLILFCCCLFLFCGKPVKLLTDFFTHRKR